MAHGPEIKLKGLAVSSPARRQSHCQIIDEAKHVVPTVADLRTRVQFPPPPFF